MSEQVFLDFSLNFNLRQTKKNMPTIIYALFTFRGRQYKVNIGAKVYPTQWNKRKQIATISNGQTRLDNRNNEIVNKKIRSLLAIFEEKKNYLCENLERIDFLFEEMRQAINPKLKCRNYMEKEMHLSATLVFRKMVDKYVKEDSSKKIYLGYISAFEAFLKVKSIPNRLSAINGDTLTDYQQYLLDLNPRRIATHLNKIKGIRTLINHANRDKEIKANININSFVAIRDERSKEQKKSKQVPLTEKQLLAIYNYTNLKPREVEARDLFICQCLLGQRISDLCNGNHITQKELAEKIGVSASQLSRIVSGETRTVSSDILIGVAKEFKVSTDYILGLSTVSVRKSYDISELGLSEGAVRGLVTGAVDVQILNRLLEHRNFPKLIDLIRIYFQDTAAKGITARNQLIEMATASLSDLMKEHPEHRAEAKQDLQLLNAQKMGEHEAEIEKIKNVFLAILRDIKKDIDNGEQPGEAVTAAMFQAMRDALAEQKQKPLSIDDVTAMIAGQIGQLAPMDEETVEMFEQFAKKVIEQSG